MGKFTEKCFIALCKHELTIAFAESVTVGALSYKFGLMPEIGKIFKGSLVCYDGQIKEKHLGVTREMIEKFTPESAEVTLQMVKGLKDFFDADISVAVTGLSDSGGSESESKPVGTVFFNILFKAKFHPFRKLYHGTPEEIIEQAAEDIFLEVSRIVELEVS
ncbi:CinA family protein [Pseudoxanthomonas sp. SGD-10]|nr:CinA family protein [Pseudoxanthomonas sp. SGD-10]